MTPPHRSVHKLMGDFERLFDVAAAEERRMRDVSFEFTDQTGTVTVQVNGYLWLTSLDIVDGTLRLGAQAVEDRIDEALRRAAQTVPEFLDAHLAQVERRLAGTVDQVVQSNQIRGDSRDAVGDSNS